MLHQEHPLPYSTPRSQGNNPLLSYCRTCHSNTQYPIFEQYSHHFFPGNTYLYETGNTSPYLQHVEIQEPLDCWDECDTQENYEDEVCGFWHRDYLIHSLCGYKVYLTVVGVLLSPPDDDNMHID